MATDEANQLVGLVSAVSDKASDSARAYAQAAENFSNLAPFKRITYFGFSLTSIAFFSEVARSGLPGFDFSLPVIYAMLASGVAIVIAGALAEAWVAVSFARRLERQASAERARAEELEKQSGGLIAGLLGR